MLPWSDVTRTEKFLREYLFGNKKLFFDS